MNNDYSEYEQMPPSKTYHIIWNILLADKEFVLTPKAIEAEKIDHIIAILPNKASFLELNIEIQTTPFTVLEYGDTHESTVNVSPYKEAAAIIDSLARNRKNVLIFCNNGYQRSLPFIAFYLVNYHTNEVPTYEKAVDIILSQVDRAGFMEKREATLNVIKQINFVT